MLGLTIGLRTLRAAQYSMDVVGQNVANAATPGYARRLSQLVTTDPQYRMGLSFGTGVEVADLRRIHDGLLELHLREQRSGLGQLDAAGGLLQQLDGALREPGDHGIAARLDALWSSFSELSVFPDDPSLRSGLAGSAGALAASFRELASQLDGAGTQAVQSARSAIDSVNTLLADLATVNKRALQSRGLGGTPADLQDERDRLLGELADWVRTDAVERPDGTVDVLVDGRLLVSGDRARPLEARGGANGSLEVRVAGTPDVLVAGGGALRGFLDFASGAAPQRRAQLDSLARVLMLEVNRLHTTSVSGLPATSAFAMRT
jgi:flagellar hook-associated protein 1 FlgK